MLRGHLRRQHKNDFNENAPMHTYAMRVDGDWNVSSIREMTRVDDFREVKFRVVFKLQDTQRTQSIWMTPAELDSEALELCKESIFTKIL